MKRKKEQKPSFVDVINFFFRSGFPSILGDKATAVTLAIFYKWNSLMRPADFRMANSELKSLSGSNSHLGRTRQKILDDFKVAGVPFITYVSNGTRRAGTYRINTNLLPFYDQINTKLTPIFGHNGNDPRGEEEEETEEDPPDYPIDGYIPGGARARARGSLAGVDKKLIEELREVFVEYDYGVMAFDSDLMRYGYEFMEGCISAFMDEIDKGKKIEKPKAYLAAIVRRRWMEGQDGSTV